MIDTTLIKDELQALKQDLSRLAGTAASEASEAINQTRQQADSLARQIQAMLGDLADTLSDEESEVAQLIAQRPMTSVAAAFAVGLVTGVLIARH